MESILNTVATILAAGVVIYGGHFLRDFLQAKRETGRQKLEREREIRDARRKDRESIVLPIRRTLTEIQTKLVMRSMLEFARKEKEKLTLEYWHKEFRLAFQKLEDYATLAD